MIRSDEVRHLLRLSPEEIRGQAVEHLMVCEDIDALHEQMANDIFQELAQSSRQQTPLRLILPVGPTGQYPMLVDKINESQLDLSRCWFFFMDEYCDEQGNAFPENHPLSFKHVASELFLRRIDEDCNLIPNQVYFPDEDNIDSLAKIIEEDGGIDTCYGGVGIHGHIAFNEPESGVSKLSCRKVRLNDFTVTINAIRSQIGGNLENYPRYAYTLGMKEILSAKQIRLYCRNGIELDWANTVLRLALLGNPGDDYPVTHIRNHSNYVIVTDHDTLATPRFQV